MNEIEKKNFLKIRIMNAKEFFKAAKEEKNLVLKRNKLLIVEYILGDIKDLKKDLPNEYFLKEIEELSKLILNK